VILLLALVVLLVAAVAWPALMLHKRYDMVIEDSLDRLSRYNRVASMRSAIEKSIAAVEKRDARKYYWKGNTPALVAADIQGSVTKIIEANQGRIISSQTLQTPDDGKVTGPAKISISVQMSASVVPLQLILYALEANAPYLFIDQLSIRGNQSRGFKPPPGVQPEVVVQLTIRGYSFPTGERKP
jgi:hypothetical protein